MEDRGLELVATLSGHPHPICTLAWSADGKWLASGGRDAEVRVWDVERQQLLQTFTDHTMLVTAVRWHPTRPILASASDDGRVIVRELDGGAKLAERRTHDYHEYAVRCLDWSRDGRWLVSGGDDANAVMWDPHGSSEKHFFRRHANTVRAVAWSPDDSILATASDDKTILLWDPTTRSVVGNLIGHTSWLHRIAWSPSGKWLISTSFDHTMRVWDPHAGRQELLVEGHTGPIGAISYSPDGRMVATKSYDGQVRLWRADTWATLLSFPEPGSGYDTIAFHPSVPMLATLGSDDRGIRIWRTEMVRARQLTKESRPARYRNAKVVLVGDSGVGKSGLGVVLAGEEFRPTTSTHGRNVWTIGRTNEDDEARELLLWDLAGQASYRVVHQLHLDQVVVAVLVFDSRTDADPFSGVRYWNRALEQALRLQGDGAPPLRKLLVLARSDRGRPALGQSEIDELVQELGADLYLETSAKEGLGIAELREAIGRAIPWTELPSVVSSELFHDIKQFLIDQKRAGRVLTTRDDLYAAYRERKQTVDLGGELDACIRAVEARGLIRRLSFGDLVLLQPELLNAYAAAIIQAARDDPGGLGCITEDAVRAGDFRMPADERIADRSREEVMLIATVEDLLRHDLALREHSEAGTQLVFPSQATAEQPPEETPGPIALSIRFAGPVENIFAALAVRLSHSGRFRRVGSWRSACVFVAEAGGECGLRLRHAGDGDAMLELCFGRDAGGLAPSAQTRRELERYVLTHVEARAIPETVSSERRFACHECSEPVPPRSAALRRERGKTTIVCAACDAIVPLTESPAAPAEADAGTIRDMQQSADIQRRREVAVSLIQGKQRTSDFDVFLCHNSADKPAVRALARTLEQRGLLPWLDEEQLRPGIPWQRELQAQLPNIRAAAVLIGEGLGPWQHNEVETLLDELGRQGRPVIPVILPGVGTPADLPLFLRRMTIVDMRADVPDPLDQLIWGITGQRPYPLSQGAVG